MMKKDYPPLRAQQGFGLTEILIALVIGLFTTLAIMHAMRTFEGQKRSTSGVSDGLTTATVSLHKLQTNIQMAGFGLPMFSVNFRPTDCLVEPIIAIGGVPNVGILPILIEDGVGPNGSDRVTVRYARANPADQVTHSLGGIPATIGAVAGSQLTLDTNMGCRVNDTALVMQKMGKGVGNAVTGACALATVTNSPPGNILVNLSANVGFAAPGDGLACLGNWTENVYQISPAFDLLENQAIVANDIVDIQAQYGVVPVNAGATTNTPTQWVDANAAPFDRVSLATTPANYERIKAVRIVVVARASVQEKLDQPQVTQPCVAQGNNNGPCAWDPPALPAVGAPPQINLAALPNWQWFRYRVLDSIVPLRNVLVSRDRLDG